MKTTVFKIILISEAILLMNFFCSCNSKDKIQLEKEKTEEVAISIINMIENNNREELKNSFKDKAIQTQDFDLGLEYIFNCYSGKCENIIDSGTHIRDLFDNGKQTKTALAYFDITTADSEFLLYFEYYLKDEINHNTSKISTLKLVRKADVSDDYNYGNYYDRIGIYNPKWDLNLHNY